MSFSISRILTVRHAVVAATMSLGLFLNLIGLGIIQTKYNDATKSSNTDYNVFGLNWFGLFYYLGLFLVSFFLTAMGETTMEVYRYVLLAFQAVGLSLNFEDLHRVAGAKNWMNSDNGRNTAFAGLVFVVFGQALNMLMVGAPDSIFGNGSSAAPAAAAREDARFSKTNSMLGAPVSVVVPTSTAAGESTVSSAPLGVPVMMGGEKATSAVSSGTAIPCPFRARAMFEYTADAKDPNEVSFAQGTEMEVTDNKGRWWKVTVTRADGTVVHGIAPSNYLQAMI